MIESRWSIGGFFAVMAVAMLAGGCAGPSAHESLNADARFVVLESLPAGEPLRAEDLYTLRSGSWVQEIVSADRIGDEGERITHLVSESDEHGSTFALDKGGARTEFWAADDEGNIIMPATLEHKKDALTIFDPPLLIAHSSLPAGEERRTQSAMKVVYPDRPERQRESGKAIRTIQYIDDQRIRTPLGEFTAKRVQVHFIADLTFADADKLGTYWVVPGVGIVAQAHEEEIRILGLISEQNRRSLVLVKAPD